MIEIKFLIAHTANSEIIKLEEGVWYRKANKAITSFIIDDDVLDYGVESYSPDNCIYIDVFKKGKPNGKGTLYQIKDRKTIEAVELSKNPRQLERKDGAE